MKNRFMFSAIAAFLDIAAGNIVNYLKYNGEEMIESQRNVLNNFYAYYDLGSRPSATYPINQFYSNMENELVRWCYTKPDVNGNYPDSTIQREIAQSQIDPRTRAPKSDFPCVHCVDAYRVFDSYVFGPGKVLGPNAIDSAKRIYNDRKAFMNSRAAANGIREAETAQIKKLEKKKTFTIGEELEMANLMFSLGDSWSEMLKRLYKKDIMASIQKTMEMTDKDEEFLRTFCHRTEMGTVAFKISDPQPPNRSNFIYELSHKDVKRGVIVYKTYELDLAHPSCKWSHFNNLDVAKHSMNPADSAAYENYIRSAHTAVTYGFPLPDRSKGFPTCQLGLMNLHRLYTKIENLNKVCYDFDRDLVRFIPEEYKNLNAIREIKVDGFFKQVTPQALKATEAEVQELRDRLAIKKRALKAAQLTKANLEKKVNESIKELAGLKGSPNP